MRELKKKARLGEGRHQLRREMLKNNGSNDETVSEVAEMVTVTEENEDLFVTVKDCDKCPAESGCKSFHHSSGDHICLCYHFKPPVPLKKEKSCPRKIVSSHQNGWPHNNFTGSIDVQVPGGFDPPLLPTTTPFPYVAVSVLITSILSLLLATFCLIKRRTLNKRFNKGSKNKMEMVDVNLLLPTDRFVNNPTYESQTRVADLAIPVFSLEEVMLSTQIGQGCFGKVFKGVIGGKLVAIKVAKKDYSDEAVKEVETMSTFSHLNILHLIGIVQNSDFDAPWLVFEFMKHGDLASVLRNSDHKFAGGHHLSSQIAVGPHAETDVDVGQEDDEKLQLTNESLLDFASQIAEGMKYLSSQHFVHRDLAARNCLVSASGMVKISDFGLSRDVYTCDYYKIGGSRLLPLRWMAPESILYGRFTLESDVWAYGILLWEIFSWGKQPYFGHSNEEVVQLILDGVLLCPPSDCPEIICRIMECCWKTEPKDRLKFHQIAQRFSVTDKFKQNLDGKKENSEMMNSDDPSNFSPFNKSTQSQSSLEAWVNSGYEVPRNVMENDYLKVV